MTLETTSLALIILLPLMGVLVAFVPQLMFSFLRWIVGQVQELFS
jgi:hypothetical protein